ncbi:hypothetical protein BH23CHL2_BH23CHL2_23220 [soil metagenome]
MPIHVIGLGNQRSPETFQDILSSNPVLARDGVAVRRWLSGLAIDHVVDLGPIFDHPAVSEIPGMIADEFQRALGATGQAAYLVPEAGSVGDDTVGSLAAEHELCVHPGAFSANPGVGRVQIIDALSIALAEERHPFDAGLATLDSRIPAIITNFRGAHVSELAGRRLERAFGRLPEANDAGTIVYPGLREPTATNSFEGLEEIVSILRSPDGCPWDREQTVDSLLPQLDEELAEFREAWQGEGPLEQADELGDVLLHIVMISQIGRESGQFTMSDVIRSISAKILRRHPHVFGDVEIESVEDLYRIWNDVKKRERAEKMEQQVSEGNRLDDGGA